ncbi:MAG: hypothetical protein Q4G14_07840 [Paracoccus sp. (in: a-proteobacteria)]|uniref:hypothetical protein n=1 Tax=Paracoccus sp. TaxID=267 RepID=UPI0026DEEFDD|nr:hypothetical protein [Paracoccus sp. (in: a-proteobacteria)]MDO5613137.1 hypothetical protein [Paracoccus sp. (in: a-proteobacteria)]
MIGVVVWSSADREKAVIWCEDQGALAYLQGRENLAMPGMGWPEAGDLMELETEFLASLRHARHVALLSEAECPGLPDALRRAPEPDEMRLRLVSSREDAPKAKPASAHAPLRRVTVTSVAS